MKEINIEGRVLNQEVKEYPGHFIYSVTSFYEGHLTYSRRKFLIFGPVVKKYVPKHIFTIFENIEDTSKTKSQVKVQIIEHLKRYDEKTKRQEEINNGELI